MKTCNTCHEDLPENMFHVQTNAPDGLRYRCHTCERRKHLQRTYQISLEEFEAMFEAQGGVCAICHRNRGKTLGIDHDHETGEIRGLLCRQCNAGIGLLDDSILLLESAIKHLGGSHQ